MKLPFRKNKEFLTALYDILGFYPHNIELYRVAFAHKSLAYRRDNPKDRKKKGKKSATENTSKPLNNERLEYLGDAVLETVVSDILFRHFEHKREGFLTSTRSKIVQRETLNKLAEEMGLDRLIQAAQGTRVDHTNIGGNAFEALMGAIYLDRGFQICHWFITNRIIGHYIDLENIARKEVNFKSKLLEWSQKNRMNIKFNDALHDNKDKGFECAIVIEGITLGRGTGRSKKEAQQAAAKEALTRMRCEAQTYDNIFRSKEKRTAMEAEESFALPKIDEIEESLKDNKRKNDKKQPVDEPETQEKCFSDEAYDIAYDENADFEVIDKEEEPVPLTEADYEAKGLPLPPEENELKTPETRAEKRRNRNRAPKTIDDAINGGRKKKNEQKANATADNKSQTPAEKAVEKPIKAAAKAENTTEKSDKPAPKDKRNKKQQRNNANAENAQPKVEEEKDNSALQTQTATIIYDEEPETDLETFDVDDFEIISPEMLAALEQEEKELHDAADAYFDRPSDEEKEKLAQAIDQTDWVKQALTDQAAQKAKKDVQAKEPTPAAEMVHEKHDETHGYEHSMETEMMIAINKAEETEEPTAVEPQTTGEKAETPAPQHAETDFVIKKDLDFVAVPVEETLTVEETETVEVSESYNPACELAASDYNLKNDEPSTLSAQPAQPETQVETETEASETILEEIDVKTEAAPEKETATVEAEPVTEEKAPAEEEALPEVQEAETEETAEETETDIQPEEAQKDKEENKPLPGLRHLSLDEFLFGITETTQKDSETVVETEPKEKKQKKSRRHNRRPKSEQKEQGNLEQQNAQENRPEQQKKHNGQQTKSADADAAPHKEQGAGNDEQTKPKRRHHRRRPAQKSESQA